MPPEEVISPAETTPAPALESTATPGTVVDAPVVENETPATPPKTFTQEEVDAVVGKRLAREQRKWEREHQQPAPQPVVTDEPKPEQFATAMEFAEALGEFKAQRIVQEREQRRANEAVQAQYHDREEDARGKYDDFDQVAYNPNLPITKVMAETIRESEVGPDVAYFLGANLKEAERISRLSPLAQAKEIGRIEAKLASNPAPTKKVTSAPAPIEPVTPRSNGANVIDTTDPRAIKSMTTSEWIEAERKRQVKKWEAQHAH